MTANGNQVGVRLSPAIMELIDGEIEKGNARSRSEVVRDWIKMYVYEHYESKETNLTSDPEPIQESVPETPVGETKEVETETGICVINDITEKDLKVEA